MNPKVTLEFTPDQIEHANLALRAQDLYFAIYEYDQWLREELKYRENHEAEAYRDKLWEFLKDYEVSLNMLS